MDFGAGVRKFAFGALAVSSFLASGGVAGHAQTATAKQPNIVVIMSDDVGWFNVGAYNRGIMAGRTPNLDKLASEGHAVHRLLCRGELHGWASQLHYG